MTSPRVKSLIPLRAKLGVGILIFAIAVIAFHGKERPDYSDENKYRVAAIQVTWKPWGQMNPRMDFIYQVGSSDGADHTSRSPFSATGYAVQGEQIRMYATVNDIDEDRVEGLTCQAYVDGNPVRTEVIPEPGKWIRCWAVVSW